MFAFIPLAVINHVKKQSAWGGDSPRVWSVTGTCHHLSAIAGTTSHIWLFRDCIPGDQLCVLVADVAHSSVFLLTYLITQRIPWYCGFSLLRFPAFGHPRKPKATSLKWPIAGLWKTLRSFIQTEKYRLSLIQFPLICNDI